MPRRALFLRLGVLVVGLTLASCASATTGKGRNTEPDLLTGLVLDAEGKAIPFAKVAMLPVERVPEDEVEKGVASPETLPTGSRGLAVTTEGGRFSIDHLSDEAGTSLNLAGGWTYEVTIYKPGYHPWKDKVTFQRGTTQLDVCLYPDTISLEDLGNLVDTKLGDTNTGVGVLRQGQ